MKEAEFDKFVSDYRLLHTSNIRLSGEDPDYFAGYKVKDAYCELKENSKPTEGLTILDFGTGIGTSISYFLKIFQNPSLICMDVSFESIKSARKQYVNEPVDFILFDGTEIPLRQQSVDLVFAACVFHHIDKNQHSLIINKFHKVLKNAGSLIIFEHNPLNPLTRHAVNTCPLDENAELILGKKMRRRLLDGGFADTKLKYRIFFPKAVSRLRKLETYLTMLPIGAQYYVHGIKK